MCSMCSILVQAGRLHSPHDASMEAMKHGGSVEQT